MTSGVDPIIGQMVLDRYRVTKRIGSGGMGVVYAAQHTNMDTLHAIKLMHLPLGIDDRVRQLYTDRFLREARLCASIRHPNMVLVTDFGIYQDTPALVMDFIKGRDLEYTIQHQGSLSEGEALTCIAAAASALAEIHNSGVIHRDIKPANLMREEGTDRIVMMDLGIAKDIADTGLTTGVLGTPAYMSPEQVRDSAMVGPASDIYSLGATLLALLIGRTPIEGTSAVEVMMAARERVFSHGSILGMLQDVDPHLSEPVKQLLRDMTRFEPRERIVDASALKQRIQDLLSESTGIDQQQRKEIELTLGFVASPAPSAGSEADFVPEETFFPGPSGPGVTPPPHGTTGNRATATPAPVSPPPAAGPVSHPVSSPGAPARVPVAARKKNQLLMTLLIALSVLAILGGIAVVLLPSSSEQQSPGSTAAPTAEVHDQTKPVVPVVQPTPTSSAVPAAVKVSSTTTTYPQMLYLDLGNGVLTEVVYVPPGATLLGSEEKQNEMPRKEVQFSRGFYMARTEVSRATYGQFLSASGASGHTPPGGQFQPTTHGGYAVEGDATLPVNYVSLHDARAFVAWMRTVTGVSVRLPSEAEWEYAARGPSANVWPWGNRWRPEMAHADNQPGPAPVGTHPSGVSWCGVEDMAGNVFEWCDDWFDSERWEHIASVDPQPDPSTGADVYHTVKGGSYANPRGLCRSAFRYGIRADDRQAAIGFRFIVPIDAAFTKKFAHLLE